MLHLRPSDYRVMPWKDGGGSTTEIAIDPPGASLGDAFLWRVSSARVEASGPFSRFPGYERILVLLQGRGFLLDFQAGGRQRLKQFEHPVTFPGDTAVAATLIQGHCVDFGVIFDPKRVQATVQALRLGPDATSVTLAPTNLFFAPEGGVTLDPLRIRLGAQESVYLTQVEAPEKVEARAEAPGSPLVVVAFTPV